MPGGSSGHSQGGHAKTSFWSSSPAENFHPHSQVREGNLRHLALARRGDVKRKIRAFLISLPWGHVTGNCIPITFMPSGRGSQGAVPGPAASASLKNLLEMQISRPTEQETLEPAASVSS